MPARVEISDVAIVPDGVKVTFRNSYVVGSNIHATYTRSAMQAFGQIGLATGSCEVRREDFRTVVLVGQQANPNVNSLKAIRGLLSGNAIRPTASPVPTPRPPRRRSDPRVLADPRWVIWYDQNGEAQVVASVTAVPADRLPMVDVTIQVSGGFAPHEIKRLEEAVAGGSPQNQVITHPDCIVVRYAFRGSNDTELINGVFQLMDMLGKML